MSEIPLDADAGETAPNCWMVELKKQSNADDRDVLFAKFMEELAEKNCTVSGCPVV